MLNLLIGIAVMIIGYVLMAKQPVQSQSATSKPQKGEIPQVSAGAPAGVLFGTKTFEAGETNILWHGDKLQTTRLVDA